MQYSGGINTPSTHKQGASTSLDGNYKADQTPIKSQNNVENIGTAVFVRRQARGRT